MTEMPERPKRIIYPPIWLVFGLIAIYLLDRFLPLARFSGWAAMALGVIAILLGLSLIVFGAGLFRKADTGLIPFSEVRALVTTGIFRYSRNPMYLGMTLVLLGTACAAGTVSGLLMAPVFMLIIQLRFILPEEHMLRELFGEEFEEFCSRVRRWL